MIALIGSVTYRISVAISVSLSLLPCRPTSDSARKAGIVAPLAFKLPPMNSSVRLDTCRVGCVQPATTAWLSACQAV